MHALTDVARAIAAGHSDDPFAWLGPHLGEVRCILPTAEVVELVDRRTGDPLGRLEPVGDGLFVGLRPDDTEYLLQVRWPSGFVEVLEDPYRFGVQLGDLDLYLFSEGRHWDLPRVFGAQPVVVDGVAGVRFAVWAPNARRVSVVGPFSGWDGRRLAMRRRHGAGVWEIFVPGIGPGELYKFEVLGADGSVVQKADPVARATELPPGTASVVAEPSDFDWTDSDWMAARSAKQSSSAPISIYEVHAGSWLRQEDGQSLDWKGLTEKLIPYVARMGFTHVELLPIMEHPFGGSWGYQPLSQFAPSARFGRPDEFAGFVDECHRHGIGIILDWVPAHFPTDAHGLALFDGTHLYEHADPREGFHQDWNTLIYNLGRREVAGMLLSSALWWLEAFHVDGLRVDAVASMLYRDYSRNAGEWVPNMFGGRENLESVDFLRRLNSLVAERCPGAMTIAEESTAWPGVSASLSEGGLGFSYKWNMGWMHDTLQYAERDPLYRAWHHNEMTFGLAYAFSERFVLPISHDEVVHGKGSLYTKMPGDPWQKRATLRAYLSFMFTHPGKKLLFMGCELGQRTEWNHDREISWDLLDDPDHAGLQRLTKALNRLYVHEPALHILDAEPRGFEWLVDGDTQNSVFGYARHGEAGTRPIVVLLNMGVHPHYGYRAVVPKAGKWRELFNSDAGIFGGSNVGNGGQLHADPIGSDDARGTIDIVLPPLGALVLGYEE